jgi:hypothetical protein
MDALTQTPLTLALAKAGLAAGTTTTLTIGTTTPFGLKGKAYSKASVSNTATPTTDATTGAAFLPVPAGYGCVFVIGCDKDGNVKVSQGAIQVLDGVAAGASASFIVAPQFPAVPDTVCPFGYLVTKVGTSGAAWTFGTSNLAGPPSNVLHTFVDCITLPERPQVA